MSDPIDNPQTPATSSPKRKPRVSLAIATAFGLGYIPKAPGTFGSLAGAALYAAILYYFPLAAIAGKLPGTKDRVVWMSWTELPALIVVAVIGVWAASRAEKILAKKDPQCVVIDEVSGQQLAYLFSLTLLNWKYLLLGFILFRVFDIWKPFPARQAESLPGGLGIMADDWIAGICAALGLWIARALGL